MPYGAALDRADDPAAAAPIVERHDARGPVAPRGRAASARRRASRAATSPAARARRRSDPRDYGAPRRRARSRASCSPRPTSSSADQATAGRLVDQQLAAFKDNFAKVEHARRAAQEPHRYDVLMIASMIEREALVPRDRRLIVGGHLQPPQGGHPARDRRDAPLRAEQLDAPAAQSRAATATRPTTRASARACRRRRSATRASPRCGRRRTRRTSRTSTTWSSRAATARTRSRRPTRSSSRTSRPTTAARASAAARTRRTAEPLTRLRRPRLAGRPQPLARDAQRRLAALGLDDWRYQRLPVPPELFAETVARAARGRLRGRQRHDPAQGGRARARRPRRRPPRGRSARPTR